MDGKIKHLEMIQGVINRMASNSFVLKGWTVVLISALFALAARDSNKLYIYLAYFPSLAFWVLDGYFLRQEKLYRKLYDKVRNTKESDIDFSMDTTLLTKEVHTWSEVILSVTLSVFYGASILTILLVMMVSTKMIGVMRG